MSKFKVGDMVKIVHTDYSWCGLDVGTVHEVVNIYEFGVELMGHYDDGYSHCLYFSDYELEPVNQTNTLVVGGKYTSKNGDELECVFVRDNHAWLVMAQCNSTPAFQWTIDGKSVSLNSAYDIAFPPREVWIDTRFSVGVSNHSAPDGTDNHTARIRFKMIDGKPDWSTATVTE